MTSIMDEIVPKFRRAIGDNETPYAYADTILAEYIADSLESIQINYSHDYVVDRDTLEIEPEVNVVDQFLFIINAQIEMLNRRSNVNFSVGGLSVRRNASLDSKESLENKLDRAIAKKKMADSVGRSTTEHDTYFNRLEDWLKYITY